MKLVKVLGWVVGVPLAAFVALMVYQAVSDDMADDQTFARKSNMSVPECIRVGTGTGQSESQARAICESRAPK